MRLDALWIMRSLTGQRHLVKMLEMFARLFWASENEKTFILLHLSQKLQEEEITVSLVYVAIYIKRSSI